MPKLFDIEEIEKARELKKEGKTNKEIVQMLNISEPTLIKYLKMTDEELQNLKAQEIQEKSLKPTPTAKARVLRIYEDKLLKKASLSLVKREEIADFVEENITPLATRLNVSEVDILKLLFNFFVENYEEVKEVRKENERLKLFASQLLEISKPYWDFDTQRKEKLKEIMALIKESAKVGAKPPNEVFETALKVILAEEKNV
jgi:predicted transcriptional regulator